jgi:hypothetical protein
MNIRRCFTTVAAVLIALLCAVSPSKATVQRGFCTGWPTMPDTLKTDGYQGLFSGLAFYVGEDDVKRANEMVDLAGPGSTKVTYLERLNIMLWAILHINKLHGTDEYKNGFLDSSHHVIQLESDIHFPLKYLLFYYSDNHRLVTVLRDVKFDEKGMFHPGERGCVIGIFSHVELYDFRTGSGDKDDKHIYAPADHQTWCKFSEMMKLRALRCGGYSDIIEGGNHVFMRMPSEAVETWQQVVLMKDNMESGSMLLVEEHGTAMEKWSFNTVLITDYMKSILDKLP